MLQSKSSLETLLKTAGEVARVVAADKLFSWITRSISPPLGWLAWALRSEQDPAIVRPGGRCERDGVTDVVFVRLSSVECVIEDSGLQSSDGHEFTGRLRLKVRVIPETAELAAFKRTVLGASETLSKADLERYFQWQGRTALAELASAHTADELLGRLNSEEVRRVVDSRLGAPCLAGGLAIDEPVIAEFESDEYLDHRRRTSLLDRRKKEADARTQIQQALAAAQSQRLNHLIGMLEQMREASKAHGERTLMDLLQAFNPAERGQMYSALWRLAPTTRRTRYVAAVSGQELLLFDPGGLQRPARRHRLPETLGALRSVSMDVRSRAAGVLLVGAATGVYVVDLETGKSIRQLAAGHDPAIKVRGGFNAAAMSDQWILASHSELGIAAWPGAQDETTPWGWHASYAPSGGRAFCTPGGGQDARPPTPEGGQDVRAPVEAGRAVLRELTANAETVRCLQVHDDTIWVAVDNRVLSFPAADLDDFNLTSYAGSHSPISALAITPDAVFAGNTEGQILRWPLDDPAEPSIVRRATGLPVESIDIVDSGGVDWLIAADGQDALITTVIGDNHACRYETGAARVRRAAAAEDLFVAMNDNRDRLIAWQPDKPSAPAATVVVPYLTGRSIQDLCLIRA